MHRVNAGNCSSVHSFQSLEVVHTYEASVTVRSYLRYHLLHDSKLVLLAQSQLLACLRIQAMHGSSPILPHRRVYASS